MGKKRAEKRQKKKQRQQKQPFSEPDIQQGEPPYKRPTATQPQPVVKGRITALMDRRVFFVADRVTMAQLSLLMLTSIFVPILLPHTTFPQWGIILFVLALLGSIDIAFSATADALEQTLPNLFRSFLKLGACWFLLVFALGLWLGPARENIQPVSLLIALMYGGGYILARGIRIARRSFHWLQIMPFLCVLFGIILLLFEKPYKEFWVALRSCSPNTEFSLSVLQKCKPALRATYGMSMYLGIVISSLIHYRLLHNLYAPEGMDVVEDNPNYLFAEVLMWSGLMTFVSWALLMMAFPPIAGGGGGSKSDSGGDSDGDDNRSDSDDYDTHHTHHEEGYITFTPTKEPNKPKEYQQYHDEPYYQKRFLHSTQNANPAQAKADKIWAHYGLGMESLRK